MTVKSTTKTKATTDPIKDSEERYRSLVEASLDPLVTINPSGKITDVNEASVTITGVSRNKLRGSDFFDYFTEPEKAREVYEQVFAKGSVSNFPLTLKHRGGKLTPVLFNGSVYKNDKGEALGVVVVARDITEQKNFENELIAARKNAEHEKQLAEEAMKAKQQFLSNMSHEIRTPLNAIIGFTKVALKTNLDEKQREYLNAIKISGDALIVLINDILDLAKVEAGKMSFESIPFKLSESVHAMLHLFDTKLLKKKITLEKKYDDKIPEVLVGDPVRLHQVILNLVGNAVKFTTTGKISVKVELLAEDDEKVKIGFDISDTGIGIEEKELDSIFDNFQQAGSSTSRLYGGTGLGLAIVKQLVLSQGGTLSVKSKVGEGSTFSFTLDFKKTTEKIEKKSEPGLQVEEGAGNIDILVVEDITLNQLLIKTLLDGFGFRHNTASNGRIALEKLKEKKYDLILMDLQMPEMNGYEATEHIRNTMKLTVPIIALTADVTTADVVKCKAVGMNDYLAKPIDDKLLYSKILKFINKPLPQKGSETSGKHKQQPTVDNRCINLEYMRQHTKGVPDLMRAMIKSYIEDTPALINTMKESINNMDWETLGEAAHAIIPSFTIVGINKEFEELAKKIKEHAAKKEESEEINTSVMKIEDVCIQAMRELEDELSAL